MSEAVLQQNIRLALGLRDDIFMFRVNVGVFKPLHGNQDRAIRSAPDGTPDLLGVLLRKLDVPGIRYLKDDEPPIAINVSSFGQAFAIEVKAAKGKQRDVQMRWEEAWVKRGGIYILARSIEDVYDGLDITP